MIKFSDAIAISVLFFILLSCQEANPAFVSNQNTWLIPEAEVFVGAGRDGIASINDPTFTTTQAIDFMKEEDLVTVVQIGEDIKAYPHPILDYHEIVNDEVGGVPVAINYCPFTGTGMAWDTRLPNKERVLGLIGANQTRIYRFSSFDKSEEIQVFHDWFMGRKKVIFGSAALGIMGVLSATLSDGTPIDFLPAVNDQNLLVDTNGNEWTVLGKAVSGPLAGTQLDIPTSFMGYWFSFAIFYPNLNIY